MSSLSELEVKKRELDQLKQISALTQRLKTQLDDLSIQVKQMQDNAGVVEEVISNWDSVLRSVSQASISLLQYTEKDYEVGRWATSTVEGSSDKDPPLPETLVRIKATEDSE